MNEISKVADKDFRKVSEVFVYELKTGWGAPGVLYVK